MLFPPPPPPSHRRMAAQFRDGNNESRLWKLIVPMKNKSTNACHPAIFPGLLLREVATLYPPAFGQFRTNSANVLNRRSDVGFTGGELLEIMLDLRRMYFFYLDARYVIFTGKRSEKNKMIAPAIFRRGKYSGSVSGKRRNT